MGLVIVVLNCKVVLYFHEKLMILSCTEVGISMIVGALGADRFEQSVKMRR